MLEVSAGTEGAPAADDDVPILLQALQVACPADIGATALLHLPELVPEDGVQQPGHREVGNSGEAVEPSKELRLDRGGVGAVAHHPGITASRIPGSEGVQAGLLGSGLTYDPLVLGRPWGVLGLEGVWALPL